jgi:hypothetical protein
MAQRDQRPEALDCQHWFVFIAARRMFFKPDEILPIDRPLW